MSVAIKLEACAKTFADGHRALEPLDLDIRAGETLVLLGPSGCGKTTALRLIAGLEFPDEGGRVLFDGAAVTPIPIERRNVGMVFQSYALFPNMTVAQNIAYGLRIRRMAKAERDKRVAEMLAMMRIEELGGRSIDQLSGGQRQRVALARALAVRPRALLLDEPLTALDAKLRDQLRAEIGQLLRGLDITSIYVTHDQAEAMAIADRIVVMSKGRVEQIGTPREIYFAPVNRSVASFIGTMNRIAAERRGETVIVAGTALSWPVNGVEAGQALYCRPEDVRIGAKDATGLDALVQAVHFEGDRLRLHLALADGQRIVAFASSREPVAIGARVALSLDPATARWEQD